MGNLALYATKGEKGEQHKYTLPTAGQRRHPPDSENGEARCSVVEARVDHAPATPAGANST